MEFDIGTKVRLRDDVLQRHAMNIAPHVAYSKTDLEWRAIIRKLANHQGQVVRVFENSKHRNVLFGDLLIGIDYTELVKL